MPPTLSPDAVDTHVHLWNIDEPRFAWMRARGGLIDRTWRASDARDMLQRSGAGAGVLMSSANDFSETDFLLSVARDEDWVLAVCGWIPLDDPIHTVEALERYAREPRLRSVRDLRHHDPVRSQLRSPATVESLRLLSSAGLVYDLADGWPVIGDITDIAREIPELVIVLDHLGQPPVGDTGREFERWARDLRRFAAHENTIGKISGLSTCMVRIGSGPREFTVDAVRPVWETALAAFGVQRLMYGSDWPINLRGAGEAGLAEVLSALASELSPAEQSSLFSGTARRVYGGAPAEPAPRRGLDKMSHGSGSAAHDR